MSKYKSIVPYNDKNKKEKVDKKQVKKASKKLVKYHNLMDKKY